MQHVSALASHYDKEACHYDRFNEDRSLSINHLIMTHQYMDHFGDKAAAYQQFRPHYPDSLFQYIVQLSPHRERAWDVGTGNGQAAIALSPYFNEIMATDLKQGQLDAAEKKENICYVASPAENVATIDDHSVDLITVAQALHWFKLDDFYREVQRVAKPNALLAAWCYTLISISPAIDTLIHYLYGTILGDAYWPKERHYIDEAYETIYFPFQRTPSPTFIIERPLNFFQLMGYLNTWSALQEYKVKNQQKNPLDFIVEDLQKAWGNPENVYSTRTPIFLIAAKIST